MAITGVGHCTIGCTASEYKFASSSRGDELNRISLTYPTISVPSRIHFRTGSFAAWIAIVQRCNARWRYITERILPSINHRGNYRFNSNCFRACVCAIGKEITKINTPYDRIRNRVCPPRIIDSIAFASITPRP